MTSNTITATYNRKIKLHQNQKNNRESNYNIQQLSKQTKTSNNILNQSIKAAPKQIIKQLKQNTIQTKHSAKQPTT